MADTASEPRCNKCAKTKSEHGVNLKRCAKCKNPHYCSRDCQKADWKTHKKSCSMTPGGSSSNDSKALEVTVQKPFHKLDRKTWLHDRPKKDVYKLLVDAYRLRMEDEYTIESEVDVDSVYGGAQDGGRHGFQRFLSRVEDVPELPPLWWTPETFAECLDFGVETSGWSSLMRAIDKKAVIEHYGDSKMPMQLRMFAEAVYGHGPGGQDGTQMRKMQMQIENGSVNATTL